MKYYCLTSTALRAFPFFPEQASFLSLLQQLFLSALANSVPFSASGCAVLLSALLSLSAFPFLELQQAFFPDFDPHFDFLDSFFTSASRFVITLVFILAVAYFLSAETFSAFRVDCFSSTSLCAMAK